MIALETFAYGQMLGIGTERRFVTPFGRFRLRSSQRLLLRFVHAEDDGGGRQILRHLRQLVLAARMALHTAPFGEFSVLRWTTVMWSLRHYGRLVCPHVVRVNRPPRRILMRTSRCGFGR